MFNSFEFCVCLFFVELSPSNHEMANGYASKTLLLTTVNIFTFRLLCLFELATTYSKVQQCSIISLILTVNKSFE